MLGRLSAVIPLYLALCSAVAAPAAALPAPQDAAKPDDKTAAAPKPLQGLGEAPAPFDDVEWVQGKPIKQYKRGDFYLIAFIVPSSQTTPRVLRELVALQEAHAKDRVQIIGLSSRQDPKFEPIAGTTLHYAVNTAVPVIQASGAFYAVDKGVWFTAPTASGPWTVATSVPGEIYSIPTSSPLHYVTYVRIYGGEGDEVHVGYTPGYYGTVASSGVVVYGTGYACDPWVYDYWYRVRYAS